jgi:teichuronic acid biosynthesis glycosyltransferase TuaC
VDDVSFVTVGAPRLSTLAKQGQPVDRRSPGAARAGRLRVLVVTRIFPNCVEPHASAFHRQQLTALSRLCEVEVLAAIPFLAWAPLLGDRTRAGRLRRVPSRDVIEGVPVVHPRVPYVPGTGTLRALAPLNVPLYLAGLVPHVGRLAGRFDVVLGTWLYPDAVAAVMLGRLLGLPCVVRAHGTDVNVVSRWPLVRPILRATLRAARFAVGVSGPMVEELSRLGAPEGRAALVSNGVDRTLFHPEDRVAARRALGLSAAGRVVLFVGRLEREKGILDLIEAFAVLRETKAAPVHLLVVGEGSCEAQVRAAAARVDAAPSAARGRVILAGGQPLARVARYLAACDGLALPSWAEGMPNVVLEALAAGRPVVASNVGGVPAVIVDRRTGILVPPRDPAALVSALGAALEQRWDEAELVAAAPPSWDESAARLHELLAIAAGAPDTRITLRPHSTDNIMSVTHAAMA